MNDYFRQFPVAIQILFFSIFFGWTNAYSQTGTVSVDFKNASPKEIFENLESRTPYRFIYQKDIDFSKPLITLKKDNVSIDDVLNELQALTNLNFRRNNTNIAVNKKVSTGKKLGNISGKVIDKNGLPLPGATVRIVETNNATVSDSDGNYEFNLELGVYSLEVSFVSFQTQKITDIKLTGPSNIVLNVVLNDDAESLDEVVVTQTFQKATASTEGMLLQQKRAAQFSDGISAAQIARTPDKDVGSTLKRITGVTTIDDKYVVVRSMGERWNQAVMDGVNLPSTDPSQNQFNFDIIPTAMVESIIVSKNATPDMNANFAGGYVEVKTKDIPRKNFMGFSIGTSYNSRATFEDRLTKQEGDNDYLGFDDGTRGYPSGLATIEVPTTEAESGPFIEQSKRFTQDNFTTYKTYAAPGTSLQFSIGRVYELKNDNRFGFVGSAIFKNTQEKLEIDHTERGSYKPNTEFTAETEDGYSTFKKYGYKNSGASYSFNSTLGGMLNAGYQFGKHKITVRNTYMHMYDNQLTQITGFRMEDATTDIVNGTKLPDTRETDYPVYQTFIQNKIEGNHRFENLEINWFGAYTGTTKDTKDATFMTSLRKRVGDDILLYHEIYNAAPDLFKRSNFNNTEKDYNVGINFNYAFQFSESFKNNIKAGYFGTYKKATNQQESAALTVIGQGTDRANIDFPISQLLDGSYYRWGGFGWNRIATYGNEYIGDVKVHSPFLMLDNKFSQYVRLVWGLRAESYVYTQIASQSDNSGSFETIQKDDDVWQYLPSVNLTVSPTSKTNLRLGYNKSVLRPQFSERLNMPYYDPVRNALVLNYTGGVVSTIVENYDFKAEWFPSQGEIISFGIYQKDIKDPIEGVTQIGEDGATRTIYNMNSHSAKLFGVEFEIYKNLSFLGEGDLLKKIFLCGNAAFNHTKVTGYTAIDGTGGLYEANRPLYGQAPYNYNLGLDYIGDRAGFSIRHNAIGDQYILVGFNYDAEEIRMPYSITDAQMSYKLGKEKDIELKFGIKNLFDTVIETYNNFNSYSKIVPFEAGGNPRDQRALGAGATKKYDENLDRTLFKAWSGRSFNFSINYSF
ncbi:carboxypeptidase-like regulatory domain-containing protein [Flavobacterium sp. 1355]|uniref:carboxypeptidase-like regulatory domain-containing protein n=1 Tax=Flavobacterium sp. 1355 TaxID=2806571 RepID=UPI001AE48662|nr:carboxypeptidase-like regulatory domain-containing protein [Flavobacterium sp. 1355]MBP1222432.1 TonB-dependent receptor [Flavobacterium sp. 1355]